MASRIFGSALPLLPPSAFLFQLLCGSTALGLTSAKSTTRTVLVPVLGACSYGIICFSRKCVPPRLAGLLGGASAVFLLQYIDLAILLGWSYETHGPREKIPIVARRSATPDLSRDGRLTPTRRWDFECSGRASVSPARGLGSDLPRRKQCPSLWEKLRFGWISIWTFRHVSSKYEVRSVPQFDAEDPTYVPSRWTFVAIESLKAFGCFYLRGVLSGHFGWISRPSMQQKLVRLLGDHGGSMAPHLVTVYLIAQVITEMWCIARLTFAIAGSLAVASGLSQPKSWRPLFGSLFEAYSLKNTWGKFWHQCFRRLLTNPARKVVTEVLQLREDSHLSRTATTLLSFTISGILHNCACEAATGTWTDAIFIRFYLMQGIGVVLEESFKEAYRKITNQEKNYGPPTLISRCLGYIWVVGFTCWQGPTWVYPMINSGLAGAGSLASVPENMVMG